MMATAVLKGPKQAQEIYLAIRRDEPDKEKAAKLAWHQYKKENPDWVPKSKRKKRKG
jgi:hypothetical protein